MHQPGDDGEGWTQPRDALGSAPALDRLRFDAGGNISDVSLAQFWSESRHAVFAIGHLISDGFFMAIVVVGEISLGDRPVGVR